MNKSLNILEWLWKIPIAFLFTLSIVLGLIIFLPDHIADTLAVKDFRLTYRTFLGPAFLLTVSFSLTKLLMWTWRFHQDRKSFRHLVEQLHELSPEEKGYLAQFIIRGINTIHVAVGDGVAGGLEAKGIIYRSSDAFNILEGPPYNLQSWARKELSENPCLLNGAIGRPMTNRERVLGSQY